MDGTRFKSARTRGLGKSMRQGTGKLTTHQHNHKAKQTRRNPIRQSTNQPTSQSVNISFFLSITPFIIPSSLSSFPACLSLAYSVCPSSHAPALRSQCPPLPTSTLPAHLLPANTRPSCTPFADSRLHHAPRPFPFPLPLVRAGTRRRRYPRIFFWRWRVALHSRASSPAPSCRPSGRRA